MNRDRILYCLQTIKQIVPLSQRGLATWTGINERQVRRWVSDNERGNVPPDMAKWLNETTEFYESPAVVRFLDKLAKYREQNPPPVARPDP